MTAFGATFRVYVAGKLVDSDRTDMRHMERIDGIAARQALLCSAAEDADRPWMVEVEFDDGEHLRWGTDPAGMVVPLEMGLDELHEALMRRLAGGDDG